MHSAHVEPGWCLPRQLQVRLHAEALCLLCNYSLPSSLLSSLPPSLPPSFSRCSLMGFDLNRHWHAPSPWAHPTLHATKQLVMKYDQEEVTQPLLLDHLPLHSCFLLLSLYRQQTWTSTLTSMLTPPLLMVFTSHIHCVCIHICIRLCSWVLP